MKQKNKALFVAGTVQLAEGFLPIAKLLSEKIHMDAIFLDSLSYKSVRIEKATKNVFPTHKVTEYSSNNAYDILKKENPKILIVPDDFSIVERAFVKASKKLGIPSVLIVLYSISPREIPTKYRLLRTSKLIRRLSFYIPRYFFLIKTLMKINKYGEAITTPLVDFHNLITKYDMLGKFGCTKIFVPGNYQKEILELKGIDSNRIEIVGNIYLEKLFSKNDSKNKEVLSKLGLKPSEKVVLFATSDNVNQGTWSEEQREINFRTVSATVKKINNTRLVVSVHPKEEIEVYKDYLREDGDKAIVTNEVPISQLIPICNVFITNYSTTTILALWNKKPCIMLNLFGDLRMLPVVDRGAAVEARNERELIRAIKTLQDHRSRRALMENRTRFLEEYLPTFDDGSDARVLNILSSVIRRNSRNY